MGANGAGQTKKPTGPPEERNPSVSQVVRQVRQPVRRLKRPVERIRSNHPERLVGFARGIAARKSEVA